MKLLEKKSDGFSCVNKAWADSLAVCIGGGPSVTEAQLLVLKKAREADACRVLGINNAYQPAPWIDVLYASDPRWWTWHRDKPELQALAAEFCAIQVEHYAHPKRVGIIRNVLFPHHGYGLSLDPCGIKTGCNGGWQALNIAILSGAKTILLLGYDGAADKDGKTHFHKGHPVPTNPAAYQHYRISFSTAETAIRDAGVRVVNCNLGSRIDSFEKLPLGDFL